eukprot:Gb_40847 [translate_table: standard]
MTMTDHERVKTVTICLRRVMTKNETFAGMSEIGQWASKSTLKWTGYPEHPVDHKHVDLQFASASQSEVQDLDANLLLQLRVQSKGEVLYKTRLRNWLPVEFDSAYSHVLFDLVYDITRQNILGKVFVPLVALVLLATWCLASHEENQQFLHRPLDLQIVKVLSVDIQNLYLLSKLLMHFSGHQLAPIRRGMLPLLQTIKFLEAMKLVLAKRFPYHGIENCPLACCLALQQYKAVYTLQHYCLHIVYTFTLPKNGLKQQNVSLGEPMNPWKCFMQKIEAVHWLVYCCPAISVLLRQFYMWGNVLFWMLFGIIFDKETLVDDEVIRASKVPPTKSFTDASCLGEEHKSSASAADPSANAPNRKPQSRKNV